MTTAQTTAPERGSALSRLRTPLALGTIAAIFSIMAYGGSQVVARSLLTGETPPHVGSAVTLFAGMIVLFGFSLKRLRQDSHAPKRAIIWVMLAGILASTGAYLSFISLSLAPIVLISPIVAVSPLMTLLLAAIFLRQVERVTMRVVLGSCLVIGGVILVIVGNQ